MLFERVFKEFQRRKIRYLIVGGIAVNLHGFSRATGDLDIMLSFERDNLEKFVQAVKSLGFIPMVPVAIDEFVDPKKRNRWAREKNMKVFSVYNPKDRLEHLDVMIDQEINFEKAYKKRDDIFLDALKIPLMAIEDLIRLKEIAGRERDKIDIKALKEIREIQNESKRKKKSGIR